MKKVNELPTWSALESKHGGLLTIEQAAKLIGWGKFYINKAVDSPFEPLREFYVIAGVDVQSKLTKDGSPRSNAPKIGFKVDCINQAKEKILALKEEMGKLDNDPSLIQDYFLAKSFSINLDTLLKEIENGKWDDAIGATRYHFSKGRITYYFDRNKVLEMSNYVSINKLAIKLNEPQTTVKGWISKGWLQPNPDLPERIKNKNLWDVEHAKKQIPRVKEMAWNEVVRYKGDESLLPYNMLNESQKRMIEKYLTARSNGSKITWEDKVYYKNAFSRPEKQSDNYRDRLARILWKMVCGRNGIPPVTEGKKGLEAVRQLTKEELEKFNPDMLLLDSINEEDISNYSKGLSAFTVYRDAINLLKPFLYFLLMEVEKNYPIWRLDQEQGKQYYMKRVNLVSALNSLPDVKPKVETKKQKHKVFLTRKKILQVYAAFVEDVSLVAYKKGFKYAVMWMTGCFLGIRPEEFFELRVEHFILNKEGYIAQINDHGYGLMRLPADASKGKYSPSHPELGTLVVPNLVKLLNKYIEYLLEKGKLNKPGEGFLFRGEGESEHYHWFNEYKGFFKEFLTENQLGAIEFKTSRRSMNQLFNKTGLKANLEGVKRRAKEVQMRHDIFMNSGTVGDVHYSDEIQPNEYFYVVDAVLNFPWDNDELKKWEIENGLYEEEQAGIVADQYNPYQFIGSGETSGLAGLKEYSAQTSPGIVVGGAIKKDESQPIENEMLLQSEYNDTKALLKKLLNSSAKSMGLTSMERAQKTKELREKLDMLEAKLRFNS